MARRPMEPVEEEVDSDSETRSSDDSSSGPGSTGHGGSGGQETVIYETQPEGGHRYTGESQFTHTTQDRDHGPRSGRARGDTIAYRRRAPRGRSGGPTAADDLAHGVGSIDVSGSESYSGSYYPQPQAAYDPYGYGYGGSETSSSGGYYPAQPEGSDFAAGIFGWAPPPQAYYQSDDTPQSQSFRERSDTGYYPERVPYNTAWMQGWIDMHPDYDEDPDVQIKHRHSTNF